MARYRDRSDFPETIDAAAERLGVSATIVEKDYWVTQALRVLAHNFRGDFIFKGGTSLSKAYRLIERFSEDIDILIVERPTKGATHRLMRKMAEAVEQELNGPTTPDGSREGEHRNVRIGYRARRQSGEIRPDVLLEAGIRGGRQPSERKSVGCLLAEILQNAEASGFEDLEPFDIDVLHPGRTLMEKLALLHSEIGAGPAGQTAARHVRHYYDIHMLLGDDHALAVLRDRKEFQHILESIREVNAKWFGNGEQRPPGGWAASPAFDAQMDDYERLREAYDSAMNDLYLGRDDRPSLDEIFARVKDLAEML